MDSFRGLNTKLGTSPLIIMDNCTGWMLISRKNLLFMRAPDELVPATEANVGEKSKNDNLLALSD